MHKTNNLDDGYMGSGKLIKRAIQKHGRENFNKEILHVFDNEEDMKIKEKELVVLNELSYNLCEGGKGGFGYINYYLKDEMTKIKSEIQKSKPTEYYINLGLRASKISSERMKNMHQNGIIRAPNWNGKKHTDETKQKMRQSALGKHSGKNNSQYGTCWITNGQENKKIKQEDLAIWIENGFHKGRIIASVAQR